MRFLLAIAMAAALEAGAFGAAVMTERPAPSTARAWEAYLAGPRSPAAALSPEFGIDFSAPQAQESFAALISRSLAPEALPFDAAPEELALAVRRSVDDYAGSLLRRARESRAEGVPLREDRGLREELGQLVRFFRIVSPERRQAVLDAYMEARSADIVPIEALDQRLISVLGIFGVHGVGPLGELFPAESAAGWTSPRAHGLRPSWRVGTQAGSNDFTPGPMPLPPVAGRTEGARPLRQILGQALDPGVLPRKAIIAYAGWQERRTERAIRRVYDAFQPEVPETERRAAVRALVKRWTGLFSGRRDRVYSELKSLLRDQSAPGEMRREAIVLIQRILRSRFVGGRTRMEAWYLLRVYWDLPETAYEYELDWLRKRWPKALDFPALSDLTELAREPELRDRLKQLSPAARTLLQVEAYDSFRRGMPFAAVRRRLTEAIEPILSRERELADWKPTVGVEIEVFRRSMAQHLRLSYAEISDFDGAFRLAMHALARPLGIPAHNEELFELSAGPAYDWRTLDAMILGFKRAGFLPVVAGDYAKLHVTVVHAKPELLGVGLDAWRKHGRTIAFLEGVLVPSERRLQEGDSHLTSFRKEDFKAHNGYERLGDRDWRDLIRAEYLAGDVDISPRTSPEAERHMEALQLVDTLHTGLYAYLMRAVREDAPGSLYERYWATARKKKRRLARLYDDYWREVNGILQRHGLAWIIDSMSKDSLRKGDFLAVRKNKAAMRELEEATWRHVALMDAVIKRLEGYR